MKRREIQLTEEQDAALDAARGETPRGRFLGELIETHPATKKAAKAAGIEFAERLPRGRPSAEATVSPS